MKNNSRKNSIGRPKTFEKEEILKLAMEHFWEHGYDTTSLDDLLLAMGIKKSSFYRTFKSKEELFSSCLSLYRQEVFSSFTNLKKDIGAKKAMLMLTDMTIDELKQTGKVRGCLIVNSGKECYKKYNNLSQQITLEFNYMQELFTGFIKEAQEAGEIKNKKDPQLIAGRYMSALNGLVVVIQAGASQEIIKDLEENLKEILE